MCSISAVGRSAAANKNGRSAATNENDRASLCSFTFSDGRRCRTPRVRNHPHFCFYHAQKEARACSAQNLGKDLAYFFSGDYLSACDLSTALARLIPAVVRGDVKPRAARTVAYMMQTLLQAIHISQDEYINAFGTDGWRKSIRNSVKYNRDYRFPPAPQPAPSALRTNLRSEPSASSPQPHSAPPQPHASNPDPTPTPAPQPPATPSPQPSSTTSRPTPLPLQPPTISTQASSTANPAAVPKPQPTSPLPQTPVPANHPTPQTRHPNVLSPTAPPTQQYQQ